MPSAHSGTTEKATFGRMLQARRKALDLKQEQLADRIGYSPEMVRKVEEGIRRPSRQMVELLARALKIPEEEQEQFMRLARSGATEQQIGLPGAESGEKPDAPFYNLPTERTKFVGREAAAAAVRELLMSPSTRLLTLTGPPGIGKTRLSLKVAAGVTEQFRHGVVFVPLAPLREPSLMVGAVAGALGLREIPGQSLEAGLTRHIRDKQLLLVLDNFEQIADAATGVASIIDSAPQVKVLVTSRSPLHIYGEHEYLVPAMTVPAETNDPVESLREYESIELFLQCAASVRPDFQLEPGNAEAIRKLCRELEGVPLAIELAAARSKVLEPEDILTKLSSRLNLLSKGARDLPTRQQTLRGAIGWSYELLSDQEKAIFRRLGPFQGGCTIEAFEQVCVANSGLHQVDVLDAVAALMDQSLIRRTDDNQLELRFTMLETIREYAMERLVDAGEAEEVLGAHARFFLGLAEHAATELRGPHQIGWLKKLDGDNPNLRVALGWSAEHDPAVLARLAAALWRYWYIRGDYTEGTRWMEAALDTGSEAADNQVRASARYGLGALLLNMGDHKRAAQLIQEALELYREIDDKRGTASALDTLGVLASYRNDYTKAKALHYRALAIARELNDHRLIIGCLGNLGFISNEQGDYDEAAVLLEECISLVKVSGNRQQTAIVLNNLANVRRNRGDLSGALALYEESLAIKQELGDKEGIGSSLNGLGELARMQGNYGEALDMLQQSIEIFREISEKIGIALVLNNLGHVARNLKNYTSARHLYAENLPILVDLQDKMGLSVCLIGLACVDLAEGQSERARASRAARLLGAAHAILETIEAKLEPAVSADLVMAVDSACQILGEDSFRAAWNSGVEAPPENLIAEIIEAATEANG